MLKRNRLKLLLSFLIGIGIVTQNFQLGFTRRQKSTYFFYKNFIFSNLHQPLHNPPKIK
jgi:hypothetical protein